MSITKPMAPVAIEIYIAFASSGGAHFTLSDKKPVIINARPAKANIPKSLVET